MQGVKNWILKQLARATCLNKDFVSHLLRFAAWLDKYINTKVPNFFEPYYVASL